MKVKFKATMHTMHTHTCDMCTGFKWGSRILLYVQNNCNSTPREYNYKHTHTIRPNRNRTDWAIAFDMPPLPPRAHCGVKIACINCAHRPLVFAFFVLNTHDTSQIWKRIHRQSIMQRVRVEYYAYVVCACARDRSISVCTQINEMSSFYARQYLHGGADLAGVPKMLLHLCALDTATNKKKTIAITIIFPRPTHQLTRHICNANAAVSVSVCIRDVWTCVLYYFVCAAVCQHTCESPCVSLCVCVRQCEHIFEIKFITHLHTQTLDSRDVHVQLSRSSRSRRRRLSRQLLSVSEKKCLVSIRRSGCAHRWRILLSSDCCIARLHN